MGVAHVPAPLRLLTFPIVILKMRMEGNIYFFISDSREKNDG